ncbi:histidinol dehydrogenase [Gulosibacter faecalis]|uniref:Histidinol dehydrogenase n=1 Tax=Gulosibacter faecalis TaxID=272240 RepID=A0ABW5V2W2_9MICO|nr:histidinol dehydrogenase [Gulosibacter faecalis]
MIQTLNLRGRDLDVAELREILPRPEVDVTRALAGATELINAVREHGAEALAEQAARFDGAAPEHIRVPQADIDAAVDGLDAAVRDALEEMIRRVRAGSAAQVPPPARTELADGAVVEQRWQPVDRVGLYVPGGKAVYPSSVVMNVVPAQTAGVGSIALASPAQAEFGGLPHPTILAAAGILGVTEVYAMGGAGAIGAFAYGVADLGLAPVDVITGPGNVWVAAAKRAVSAKVGIDAEAGPTEILVIADGQANVDFVAADLLSQAEHDELAAAVLVTDSERLAGEVAERLAQLAAETKHAERVATSLGGRQSAIVLVDDLAAACRVSNAYGPEHLELQTTDDEATLAGITNAGAIFMGGFSPVPLGDYLAGSNHVLPTGGQSAHAAGLGAYTFLRAQQIIRYDAAALDAVRPRLTAIALAEDLPAHAAAAAARAERATNERTGE